MRFVALAAAVTTAEAREQCQVVVREQCQAMVKYKADEPTWMLVWAMAVFIFGLFLGIVLARQWFGKQEVPTKVEREVQTELLVKVVTMNRLVQAPVTYTGVRGCQHPRFSPLPEAAWGAWP